MVSSDNVTYITVGSAEHQEIWKTRLREVSYRNHGTLYSPSRYHQYQQIGIWKVRLILTVRIVGTSWQRGVKSQSVTQP